MPLSSAKKALDLTAEGCRGIGIPHHDHHSIITGEGAKHDTQVHCVQRGCRGIGQTRERMDDDDILSIIEAGNTFSEYRIQPIGKGRRYFSACRSITVGINSWWGIFI